MHVRPQTGLDETRVQVRSHRVVGLLVRIRVPRQIQDLGQNQAHGLGIDPQTIRVIVSSSDLVLGLHDPFEGVVVEDFVRIEPHPPEAGEGILRMFEPERIDVVLGDVIAMEDLLGIVPDKLFHGLEEMVDIFEEKIIHFGIL